MGPARPVVRLDFSGGNFTIDGAVTVRAERLDTIASDHCIDLGGP